MNSIKDKKILITGGTGSFGSTMVANLLDLKPRTILVFSRDELKQFHMRNNYPAENIEFIVGDVRDYDSIYSAMRGVDYVFHAAALKQVPACEFFPLEAIRTNILGGNNVMTAAIARKVRKVVVLSTDKAVYPINTMGMSKALMEKTMIAHSRNSENTNLCGVRYGNVMYSRGSVIPLFIQQIKNGKKLTITEPSMTRFLLPLRDSVRLVLHALAEEENGSIYIKKAPVADLLTLAQAVCELFEHDKGFEIVGIRAGEKVHETLISKEEWVRVRDEGDFYQILPETKSLEYKKYFEEGKKLRKIDREGYTSENTKRLTVNQTKKLLLSLPEIQKELRTYR